MVEKVDKKEIDKDFVELTPEVNGRILKVVCRTKNWMPHVRVTLKTSETEEVINHTIDNNINVWKPFYVSEQANQGTTWTDYFYSHGRMFLSVQGMKDGDYIQSIEIFFE